MTITEIPVPPLVHEHGIEPFTDQAGNPVTLTEEQVQAVWHAVYAWDRLRPKDDGARDTGQSLIDMRKSRLLGRLLIDGLPLFAECPPPYMSAANYPLWDLENEMRLVGYDRLRDIIAANPVDQHQMCDPGEWSDRLHRIAQFGEARFVIGRPEIIDRATRILDRSDMFVPVSGDPDPVFDGMHITGSGRSRWPYCQQRVLIIELARWDDDTTPTGVILPPDTLMVIRPDGQLHGYISIECGMGVTP